MSPELPDFTTAPVWMDGGGDVYVNLFCGLWDHRKDRAVDANELRSWAPWTPLDTADEWVQRIDRDALAEVLDGCFPGCDGPAAEGFIERYVAIAVDAVLAALPDLMGGVACRQDRLHPRESGGITFTEEK